ncbi:MAG: hypothetical protein VB934_03965 [Polyangiaceae bacterium]
MKTTGLKWMGLFLFVVAVAGTLGCGGSPLAPSQDEVFYLHERGVIDKRFSWERYFPPLDRDATQRLPRRVGVALFNGDVRMSRPIDWYLRTADYTPERRMVSYQSPRQFIFNIYERTDPVEVSWDTLLERYEEKVKSTGSTFLSGRVPVATANAQGRSYLVKSLVAAKPNYETFAHEVMVRSNRRIMLVQIVHPENVEATVDEITAALRSMRVY